MHRLSAALVVCACLAACGMKGPLYLPEGESDAPPLDDRSIDPVTDPSRAVEAEDTDRFENPEDTGETLDEDEDEDGDESDEPADDGEAADPS